MLILFHKLMKLFLKFDFIIEVSDFIVLILDAIIKVYLIVKSFIRFVLIKFFMFMKVIYFDLKYLLFLSVLPFRQFLVFIVG
jgi:hypothetical protein